MKPKVFIIQGEGIGRGDDKLGKLLMANFLRLLGDNPEKPEAIIFMNAGVKLCTEGSDVIKHLQKLEDKGVELLACTTCLEYFDLMEKLAIGKATTMVASIQSMMEYDIVSF